MSILNQKGKHQSIADINNHPQKVIKFAIMKSGEMKKIFLLIFQINLLAIFLLSASGCLKFNENSRWQNKLLKARKKIEQSEKNIAELKRGITNLKRKANQIKNPEAENNIEKTLATKKIGYIKKIYVRNNKTYLEVDEVEFFSGKEAVKAAIEDGLISSEKELGSDYYVRNKNKQVKTYLISPKVYIYLKTFNEGTEWDPKIKKGVFSLSDFSQVFIKNDPNNQILINDLFWLTLTKNQVVKILEQPLIEEPCST